VIEKLLSRIAICAATVLPLAHLSSLGVMEASGFVLMIASLALFALECGRSPSAAVSRVRSGAALPIAVYTVFTLLSIGVMLDQANDQIAALRELKWVLYLFAFLYFFDRFWSDTWERYAFVLSGAVALMGLLALCQFLYGWEWPRAESVLEPWGGYFRVTGFFNTPQSFAGNLGMATLFLLGFTLSQFAEEAKVFGKKRVLLLLSVAMGALGVCLTLTRSAWLGGAITVAIAFGRVKKSWGAIALLIMATMTATGLYSESTFNQRLSSDVSVNGQSIEIRQELWDANWRMFQDFPYLGIGPDQNIKQLDSYYEEAKFKYRVIDRAHSNALELLSSRGIFVAIFYAIFSGYFLWIAYWLSIRQSAGSLAAGVGAGSLLAQIYFHILGLVDSNFFDQEVKNVVVWVWALTAAAYGRSQKRETA
jgi:hypothetical protein